MVNNHNKNEAKEESFNRLALSNNQIHQTPQKNNNEKNSINNFYLPRRQSSLQKDEASANQVAKVSQVNLPVHKFEEKINVSEKLNLKGNILKDPPSLLASQRSKEDTEQSNRSLVNNFYTPSIVVNSKLHISQSQDSKKMRLTRMKIGILILVLKKGKL
jgi:hypothetical protein